MRALFVASALLLFGCRGPGPHEDERGKITYWLITGDEVDNTSCSNNSQIESMLLSPLNLGAGIAYYYIYSVGADGKTAIDQDCDYYDYNKCTPNSNVVFQVTSHILTATAPPETLTLTNDCLAQATFTVRLEDKGGELDAVETVRFDLIGDSAACTVADDQIRSASPNGKGVMSCVSRRKIHAAFSQIRTPGK